MKKAIGTSQKREPEYYYEIFKKLPYKSTRMINVTLDPFIRTRVFSSQCKITQKIILISPEATKESKEIFWFHIVRSWYNFSLIYYNIIILWMNPWFSINNYVRLIIIYLLIFQHVTFHVKFECEKRSAKSLQWNMYSVCEQTEDLFSRSRLYSEGNMHRSWFPSYRLQRETWFSSCVYIRKYMLHTYMYVRECVRSYRVDIHEQTLADTTR